MDLVEEQGRYVQGDCDGESVIEVTGGARGGLDWGHLFGAPLQIDSVLVPGYVDLESDDRRVNLFPTKVAIGTKGRFIVFSRDGYRGQMRFCRAQKLSIPKELIDEPESPPVVVDLNDVLLPEYPTL